MSTNVSLGDNPGISAYFDGQPIQDLQETELRREEERQEKELRRLLEAELEDFEDDDDFLSGSNSEEEAGNDSLASGHHTASTRSSVDFLSSARDHHQGEGLSRANSTPEGLHMGAPATDSHRRLVLHHQRLQNAHHDSDGNLQQAYSVSTGSLDQVVAPPTGVGGGHGGLSHSTDELRSSQDSLRPDTGNVFLMGDSHAAVGSNLFNNHDFQHAALGGNQAFYAGNNTSGNKVVMNEIVGGNTVETNNNNEDNDEWMLKIKTPGMRGGHGLSSHQHFQNLDHHQHQQHHLQQHHQHKPQLTNSSGNSNNSNNLYNHHHHHHHPVPTSNPGVFFNKSKSPQRSSQPLSLSPFSPNPHYQGHRQIEVQQAQLEQQQFQIAQHQEQQSVRDSSYHNHHEERQHLQPYKSHHQQQKQETPPGHHHHYDNSKQSQPYNNSHQQHHSYQTHPHSQQPEVQYPESSDTPPPLPSTLPPSLPIKKPDVIDADDHREFFQIDVTADQHRVEQLEILYRARGRELEELRRKLEENEEEAAREKRSLKHRAAVAEGEVNGTAESLKQSQRLLQQAKGDHSEALGKISALEKELSAAREAKEELVKKLGQAESTIETLSQHVTELSESDSVSRARREHEAVVSGLTQRYQRETLLLKEQLDIVKTQLAAKTEELSAVREQLGEATQALEQAQVSRGETVNRLSASLEESQRRCQDLLQQLGSGEVATLRVKLQHCQESNRISEEMCKTYQGDLKELKEQLAMYETATSLGALSTHKATPALALDDSMTDLGIRKTLDFSSTPQSSDGRLVEPATPQADGDLVASLRSELERCLRSNREKRSEVTELRKKVKDMTSLLDKGKLQIEELEKTCSDQKKRLSQLKDLAGDDSSVGILEAKLRRDLDKMGREKKAMEEDINDLQKRLEEVGASEARLTEINAELNSQLVATVTAGDEDKADALRRCQRTMEEAGRVSLDRLREEMAERQRTEVEVVTARSDKVIAELRQQLTSAVSDLDEVKAMYVKTCQEAAAQEGELTDKFTRQMEEERRKIEDRVELEKKEWREFIREEVKKEEICGRQATEEEKMRKLEQELRAEWDKEVELKLSQARLEALQETRQAMSEERQDWDRQKNEMEEDVKNKASEILSLSSKLVEATEKLESLGKEMKALKENKKDLVEEGRDSIEERKTDGSVVKSEGDDDGEKKEIEGGIKAGAVCGSIESLLTAQKSDVSAENVNEITEHRIKLKDLEKKIEDQEKEIERLSKNLEEKVQALEEKGRELDELRSKGREAEDLLALKGQAIADLNERLRVQVVESEAEVDKYRKRVEELEIQLKRAESEGSNTSDIDGYKKRVEELEAQLKKAENAGLNPSVVQGSAETQKSTIDEGVETDAHIGCEGGKTLEACKEGEEEDMIKGYNLEKITLAQVKDVVARLKEKLKVTVETHEVELVKQREQHRCEFERAARQREEKFQSELRYFLKEREEKGRKEVERKVKEVEERMRKEVGGSERAGKDKTEIDDERVREAEERVRLLKEEHDGQMINMALRHQEEEKEWRKELDQQMDVVKKSHVVELRKIQGEMDRQKKKFEDERREMEGMVSAKVKVEALKMEAEIERRVRLAEKDKWKKELEAEVEEQVRRELRNERGEKYSEESLRKTVEERVQEEREKWFKNAEEYIKGEIEKGIKTEEERIRGSFEEDVEKKVVEEVEELKKKFTSELNARVGLEKSMLEQEVAEWKREARAKIERDRKKFEREISSKATADREKWMKERSTEIEGKVAEEKKKMERELKKARDKEVQELRRELEEEMRRRIDREREEWEQDVREERQNRQEGEKEKDNNEEVVSLEERLKSEVEARTKACAERDRAVAFIHQRETAYKEERQRLLSGLERCRGDLESMKGKHRDLEEKCSSMDVRYKEDMREARKRREKDLSELRSTLEREKAEAVKELKEKLISLRQLWGARQDGKRGAPHVDEFDKLSLQAASGEVDGSTILELRDHYVETVARIKADVLSHVEEANVRAAATMRAQIRKQKVRVIEEFKVKVKACLRSVLLGQVSDSCLASLGMKVDELTRHLLASTPTVTSSSSSSNNTPRSANSDVPVKVKPVNTSPHKQQHERDTPVVERLDLEGLTSPTPDDGPVKPGVWSKAHTNFDQLERKQRGHKNQQIPSYVTTKHNAHLSFDQLESRQKMGHDDDQQLPLSVSQHKAQSADFDQSESVPRRQMKVVEARVRLANWARSGEAPWNPLPLLDITGRGEKSVGKSGTREGAQKGTAAHFEDEIPSSGESAVSEESGDRKSFVTLQPEEDAKSQAENVLEEKKDYERIRAAVLRGKVGGGGLRHFVDFRLDESGASSEEQEREEFGGVERDQPTSTPLVGRVEPRSWSEGRAAIRDDEGRVRVSRGERLASGSGYGSSGMTSGFEWKQVSGERRFESERRWQDKRRGGGDSGKVGGAGYHAPLPSGLMPQRSNRGAGGRRGVGDDLVLRSADQLSSVRFPADLSHITRGSAANNADEEGQTIAEGDGKMSRFRSLEDLIADRGMFRDDRVRDLRMRAERFDFEGGRTDINISQEEENHQSFVSEPTNQGGSGGVRGRRGPVQAMDSEFWERHLAGESEERAYDKGEREGKRKRRTSGGKMRRSTSEQSLSVKPGVGADGSVDDLLAHYLWPVPGSSLDLRPFSREEHF